MNREVHVRFCEKLGVRLPLLTRPNQGSRTYFASLRSKRKICGCLEALDKTGLESMGCFWSVFSKINPLWIVVIVNMLVPYMAYVLAHRNNKKLIIERWLSEFRGEIANLIAIGEERTNLSESNLRTDKPDEYNAKINDIRIKSTMCKARIVLLFKQEFQEDQKIINYLINGFHQQAHDTDAPDSRRIDKASYLHEESEFLKGISDLIEKYVAKTK